MTLDLVLLLLGALVLFVLSTVALRRTKVRADRREDYLGADRRDPVLHQDAHIDARRRELARLNRPAAKGFRAAHGDGPRWRFDPSDAPKKRPQ